MNLRAKHHLPTSRCSRGVLQTAFKQAEFCRNRQAIALIILTKIASENRSVGGSTPRLGTILFNDLAAAKARAIVSYPAAAGAACHRRTKCMAAIEMPDEIRRTESNGITGHTNRRRLAKVPVKANLPS